MCYEKRENQTIKDALDLRIVKGVSKMIYFFDIQYGQNIPRHQSRYFHNLIFYISTLFG